MFTSLVLTEVNLIGAFGLIVSVAANWFGFDWSKLTTTLANFVTILNAVCAERWVVLGTWR